MLCSIFHQDTTLLALFIAQVSGVQFFGQTMLPNYCKPENPLLLFGQTK